MAVDRNRAVYVISVAAELAGMHPQTLRIYERKGLLEPARTQGGSRRYSDEDIAMLARIRISPPKATTSRGCAASWSWKARSRPYRVRSTRCARRRPRLSRTPIASTAGTWSR
jgi:MerR HTH family regulatory protein